MGTNLRPHEQFRVYRRIQQTSNPMSTSLSKTLSLIVALALLLLHIPATSEAETNASPSPVAISASAGERMYRDGLLPSGEAIQAFVKGDLPVPGTAFSCASCHLRGGMGATEGGVFTPPITGQLLFQPFKVLFKGLVQKYYSFPDRRPAYNDTTLAEVIRSGTTPTNTHLNDVMPRYMLDDAEMVVLISYLRTLSAQPAAGVSETTIHFATIITDDVSNEEQAALLEPLQQYINIKNNQASAYKINSGRKSRQMVENMLVSKELSTRNISLSVWQLHGSSNTWRKQLDDYYRSEPVFALLGGISNGSWHIIHTFCEDNKLPCLFPQTDLPVVSASDWYTLYLSKGYVQEGQAAAQFINRTDGDISKGSILQLVRKSPAGNALAAGFMQTISEQREVTTLDISTNEQLTADFLIKAITSAKPGIVVLWDDIDGVTALKGIMTHKNKPQAFFVSGRYLGGKLLSLPESLRSSTYITYPYTFAKATVPGSMGSRILVEDESSWNISSPQLHSYNRAKEIRDNTETLTQLLTMALMDMRGTYSRDVFFDAIGMLQDQPSNVYARLSFGPGQRFASKGCYIVQLTPGITPGLTKKSPWVIH